MMMSTCHGLMKFMEMEVDCISLLLSNEIAW